MVKGALRNTLFGLRRYPSVGLMPAALMILALLPQLASCQRPRYEQVSCNANERYVSIWVEDKAPWFEFGDALPKYRRTVTHGELM